MVACPGRVLASTTGGTRTDRLNAIAGICNERRNVFGMMPHPERACEALLGGTDGKVILESVVAAFAGTR